VCSRADGALSEYNGPSRSVGEFVARPMERKDCASRTKTEAKLCTLRLKDKFILFVQDSVDRGIPGTDSSGAGSSARATTARDRERKRVATRYGADFWRGTPRGSSRRILHIPGYFRETRAITGLGHGSGKKRSARVD